MPVFILSVGVARLCVLMGVKWSRTLTFEKTLFWLKCYLIKPEASVET